jgi:hypothetical protein
MENTVYAPKSRKPFYISRVEQLLIDEPVRQLLLYLLIGAGERAARLVQHVLFQVLLQEVVGAQMLVHVAQVSAKRLKSWTLA